MAFRVELLFLNTIDASIKQMHSTHQSFYAAIKPLFF